jgi:RNase P subunit RPR2
MYNTLKKRYKYKDETLSPDKRKETIKILSERYVKIIYNEWERRTCKNCQNECLAVRNYLRIKFTDWTPGNNNIDNLIQQCELDKKIIELDFLKSIQLLSSVLKIMK